MHIKTVHFSEAPGEIQQCQQQVWDLVSFYVGHLLYPAGRESSGGKVVIPDKAGHMRLISLAGDKSVEADNTDDKSPVSVLDGKIIYRGFGLHSDKTRGSD